MNRNSFLNKNFKEIAELLVNTNAEDAYLFLSEILTSTEFETISKRWEIIKMLDKGVSQRDISKELNVSLCKVTRGSKILKNSNSIIKKLCKRSDYEH